MTTNYSVLPVERMLLRDREQDALLRIVYIDPGTRHTWLCRVDDDSWPYPMPSHRLQEELDPESGRFVVEPNDPWAHPGVRVDDESAAVERHKRRYALIEPLVGNGNERQLLYKRDRKALIAKRLEEAKSTRQTIGALLKLYWKRGMTFEALRTDYPNCGSPGKRRDLVGKKKIGAPRTVTPGVGINANDEVRRMLRVGADFYLSRKKPTLKEALDHVVRFYFSKRVKDENKRVVAFQVEPDAKPTVRQLQYYINTHFPYRHIRRRRYGDKDWNLHGRELLGAADGDVQGPGDRFQIDATVADVYLVSQFDRRRIVGRPVLYFVIDVFSRLITGLYVGFEGPSWAGAMMTLVNMVTPKVEFCRQHGIDIEEADWPSHHAPRRVMGDRGELMSIRLGANITRSLHIEIENASPGRPDLKALIERRFGIVPAKFRQFTPGYVEKDFNERGSRDYRLDAALDLHEFTQLVIYAVLEHNFTPIRDVRLPADMVTDGLTAAPIDLWQWGVENRSGYLKTLTVEEVSLNVMPSEIARVTAKGIKLKGGYYSCPTAIREDWFAMARREEREVAVSFDPRNMGNVYLRDPRLSRGFEPCRLLDGSAAYGGKSLFEIEELGIASKRAEAAGENDRQAKRVLIDQRMAEIESKAKKATRAVADADTPKSKKTAAIRGNRADEKEVQRGAETFFLEGAVTIDRSADSPSPPAPTSSIATERSKNALALLRSQRDAHPKGGQNG